MDVMTRPGPLLPFARALGASIVDASSYLAADGVTARVGVASGVWELTPDGDGWRVTRPDGQTAVDGTIASAVAAAKVL